MPNDDVKEVKDTQLDEGKGNEGNQDAKDTKDVNGANTTQTKTNDDLIKQLEELKAWKTQKEKEELEAKNRKEEENLINMSKEEFDEFKKKLNSENATIRHERNSYKEKVETYDKQFESLKEEIAKDLSEEDKGIVLAQNDLATAFRLAKRFSKTIATNSQGATNVGGRPSNGIQNQTIEQLSNSSKNYIPQNRIINKGY